MPTISIIMPVYNTPENYLRESIESILNQTYTDFEFIIINDGSTGNEEEIILSYNDERIKYVKQENIGIVGALNHGLELATGKYIARMDADDISLSNRLEEQITFMDNNPQIVLTGTLVEEFNDTGVIKPLFAPFKFAPTILDILYYPIICHPTAMFRKDVLEKNNIKYSENYKHAEDQDLWRKFLQVGEARVIQKKLLNYRRHNESVSCVNGDIGYENYKKIKVEIINKYLPKLKCNLENLECTLSNIWNKFFAIKTYDHIVLLGENCELAYQYVNNLGDPESGLFNWCFVVNKDNLLKTINNPNIVKKQDYNIKSSYAMIDDSITGCSFHCSMQVSELLDKNGKINVDKYKMEKNNLKSKNIYLAEKLNAIYKMDNKKLFIYKAQQLRTNNQDTYIEFLKNLNKTLLLKNNNTNADILFVVTEEYYEVFKNEFIDNPNIFIRKVKRFTEIGDAVNGKISDNKGWQKIFEEFRPNRLVEHTKEYKYEKNNKSHNSLIQNIFSVKNSIKHKVITILGIKFKFKSKKLLNKAGLNENSFVEDIFSVKNQDIRKVVTILGLKFKFKSKKLIEQKKWNDLYGKLNYLENKLNNIDKNTDINIDTITDKLSNKIICVENEIMNKLNQIEKKQDFAKTEMQNNFDITCELLTSSLSNEEKLHE